MSNDRFMQMCHGVTSMTVYTESNSQLLLQELHMTGCMLMADDFCLVVAEGSQKSHKKYSRLMLNRIDWNQSQEEEQQGQSAALVLVCKRRAPSHQHSCVGFGTIK